MQIDAALFSDPTMRPHLEKYYEHKKDEFAKALAERESMGEITLQDGTKGTPLQLTVDMMVPFDKWLELMQHLKLFDPVKRYDDALEQLESLKSQTPQSPSGIATTLSNGDKLLAYIRDDGGIVFHSGGQMAQHLNDKDQIIKYLQDAYPQLDITEYTPTTQPTRLEFADMWYPKHTIIKDYEDALTQAHQNVKQLEDWGAARKKAHDAMRDFLLQSMQSA